MGIDLGVTSALAFLDMDGNLLALVSKRNFSQDEIISYLEETGKPVVVATDRKKPSRKLGRIASAFGAYLFVPEKDMRVKEKEELLRGLELEHPNNHEKDALAAALNAYNSFDDLFKRIESRVRKKGLQGNESEVKASVLKSKSHNIDQAIRDIANNLSLPD